MSDSRFYLLCAIVLITLTVLAGAIFNLIGLKQEVVTSTIVTFMGFTALIIAQYRTAMVNEQSKNEVKRSVLEVKTDLKQTNKIRDNEFKEIHDLATATNEVAQKTLKIVNGRYGILLTNLAIALRTVAKSSPSEATEQAAVSAEQAALAHWKSLNEPQPSSSSGITKYERKA